MLLRKLLDATIQERNPMRFGLLLFQDSFSELRKRVEERGVGYICATISFVRLQSRDPTMQFKASLFATIRHDCHEIC